MRLSSGCGVTQNSVLKSCKEDSPTLDRVMRLKPFQSLESLGRMSLNDITQWSRLGINWGFEGDKSIGLDKLP